MGYKIGLVILTAILSRLGGKYRNRYRDVGIPFLIGIYFGIVCKDFWVGFWTAGTYNVMRLGYGNYSPDDDPEPSLLATLTHDYDGWYIRGIWGLLVGILGAFPLLYFGYLPILKYMLYILINGLTGFLVSKLKFNSMFAEGLQGIACGSILLMI